FPPECGVDAHPIDERCQPFRIGAVMGLPALAAVAHEAGLFQHAQMFRDRRLRDAGVFGKHPDGLLALAAQAFVDRPARGIAEGQEDFVGGGSHIQSITWWLWIVKRSNRFGQVPKTSAALLNGSFCASATAL